LKNAPATLAVPETLNPQFSRSAALDFAATLKQGLFFDAEQ
jgi:hypothetical protein